MNVTKRILVIDDEDQKNDMESIARNLKKHVQIKYEQINVLDSDFLDEKLNLRQDVFEKKLMEVLTENYYDLILVDYNYGDISLDGLGVVKFIKEKKRNSNIILYSANQSEIIRNILAMKQTKPLSDNDVVKAINALMNYRILKMCARDSYVNEVVRLMSIDTQLNPTSMLCEMLREYGDMKFSSCCPSLSGKKFSEIANMLEEQNNGKATEWLNAVFEQLITYLVEING